MPLLLAEIKDGHLRLIPETLLRIKQFPGNVKWIGVIGAARQGKSFLIKHLSGQNFSVSPEIQPCTSGVWISEPLPLNTGEHIVYVDSEGTDMGDTRQQHKILVFVCLLLSEGGVLIDNEATYGNSSLNVLPLLASAHQLIRGVDDSCWPHLCFLLRNFNNPLIFNGNEITTDKFLEYILAPKNDARDADRQLIRDCFQRRILHTLPSPTKEDQKADQLSSGRFLSAIMDLRKRLETIVTVKKVGGIVCDGPMLAVFLEECVSKINERGNVNMTSTIETVMNAVCSHYVEEMVSYYTNCTKNTVENLTGNEQELQESHDKALQSALTKYNERTQGIYAASVDKYREVLLEKIDTQYQLAVAQNQTVGEQNALHESKRQLAEEQAARARDAQEAAQRLAQEQAAREKDAQIAAARLAHEHAAREAAEQRERDNSTFLNFHGFKIGGKRIW